MAVINSKVSDIIFEYFRDTVFVKTYGGGKITVALEEAILDYIEKYSQKNPWSH